MKTENNSLFTEVTVEESATVSGGQLAQQLASILVDNQGTTLLLVPLTSTFTLFGAARSVTSSGGNLVEEGKSRGLSEEAVLSIVADLKLTAGL